MVANHMRCVTIALFVHLFWAAAVDAKDRLFLLTVQGSVAGADADVDTIGEMIGAAWDNTQHEHLDQSDDPGSEAILRRVDQLAPGSDDVVLFYYTGHGATAEDRHFLDLDNGERLYRDELRRRLVARGARLTIILTDCCAGHVRDVPSEQGAAAMEGVIEQNLARLFSYRGVADITGAAIGQLAWGEPHGGIFTTALGEVLWRPCKSWQDLYGQLLLETQRNYRRFRAAGLRPDSGLYDRDRAILRAQTTQTPQHFGLPGGLRIYRVFPYTAATKLTNARGRRVRPEPNDRLVSINGQYLTDSDQFERLIDGVPRGAAVTLTIIDSRDGEALELHGNLDQGGDWRLGLGVKDLDSQEDYPVNGLLITTIYRATAATKLESKSGRHVRLEPGDRLVAIDGQPLRDHEHFQQVVRDMPRNADFTMTIVNKRDGQLLDLYGQLDQGGRYRLGLFVKDPR